MSNPLALAINFIPDGALSSVQEHSNDLPLISRVAIVSFGALHVLLTFLVIEGIAVFFYQPKPFELSDGAAETNVLRCVAIAYWRNSDLKPPGILRVFGSYFYQGRSLNGEVFVLIDFGESLVVG